MPLSLATKLIIFAILLVVLYFVFKYFFEIDLLEMIWLSLMEAIQSIEWSLTALVLTFVFSGIMWAIMWKNPIWVDSTFFTPTYKIILSILLPLIGYPLAVSSLNKN